jgi:hypothetical protein
MVRWGMHCRAWRTALALALLAPLGCAWLGRGVLPRERDTDSPFVDFRGADQAFGAIRPGETTVAELRALRLDPASTRGGSVRSFLFARELFQPHRGLAWDLLDPGVRRCLDARHRCEVWAFELQRMRRRRVGNVVLDLLRFRRERHRTGFAFSGEILLVDEVVVYVQRRGTPRIEETKLEVRPLGPLQEL